MSYGVLLGYRLAPGGRWKGEYVVADLSDFIGKSLHEDAEAKDFRIWPHITEQVKLGSRGVCFPLKPRYDKANLTLDGVESHAQDGFGVPLGPTKFVKSDFSHDSVEHEGQKFEWGLFRWGEQVGWSPIESRETPIGQSGGVDTLASGSTDAGARPEQGSDATGLETPAVPEAVEPSVPPPGGETQNWYLSLIHI